jgi:hypothetical protein
MPTAGTEAVSGTGTEARLFCFSPRRKPVDKKTAEA